MKNLKAAVCLALALPALRAAADLVTWDGGAGTGTNQIWANTANWNPDGAPVATNDYLVQGSFTIRCPDLDGNLGLNGASLMVTNGATLLMYATYNGGGATRNRAITNLTIAGSTLNSQTSNGTFTHALTQRARFLGNSSIGLLNAGYGVGLNLSGGVEGSGTINVARNNSGSTSTLLLGGYAGDYAGSWMITGRTASLTLVMNVATTNNSGWGSGTLSIGNFGAVTVQSNILQTSSLVIFSNATAALTVNGSRSVTLGGIQSTVGGSITINAGSTVTVGQASTDRSFNGVISGAGAFAKQDANMLTVSSNLTFTGGTFVRGGTLRLAGGANGLATSGNVTISDVAGATLDLNGRNQQVANLKVGGATGGQVSLGGATVTVTGGGTLGGTIAGTGTVALTGSAFAVDGTGRFDGPQTLSVGASATADVSVAGYTFTNGQTLAGSGMVKGNVTAADGTMIRPGGAVAGTLTVDGNLSLGTQATNYFDLSADPLPGGANDLLLVGGQLVPGGSRIYVRPNPALTNGTYTLINFGTKLGTFDPVVIAPMQTRSLLTLDETSNPNAVLLVVTGTPASVRWSGGTDTSWDGGITNWQFVSDATDTRFFDGDTVFFDDLGATQNIVTIGGTVLPAAITVSSASNYQFTGAGAIGNNVLVPTTLTKAGQGALQIDVAGSFSGGTVVSNGSAVAGNDTAFGTGGIALAGGSLGSSGGARTLANALNLAAATNLVDDGGGTFTLAGAITGGPLRKIGSGNVVLAGTNSFGGLLTVRSGGVFLRNPNSAGTVGIVLGDDQTGGAAVSLYLDQNRQQYTRNVLVSSNGSGTATLGSRSTVGGTGDNNNFQNITLQRDVVFDSNAGDRTDYRGVTGVGNIRITGVGRTVIATVNTFTGNVTVATTGAGQLQSGVATAGNQNYIPDTSTLTVESGALYRLSSGGENVDGLNGGGSINVNAINGALRVGASGGAGTFSGVMSDGGANKISLVKLGAGTQVMSGPNTFSGTVSIEGGTLSLGGTGSMTGATLIAVGTGAVFDVSGAGYTVSSVQTLRGNGTVQGDVVASAGSQLAAGSTGPSGSRETLTINGALLLNAGQTNLFNLGPVTNTGGAFNDLIVVNGSIDPAGATIAIEGPGPLANGAYRLFTYTGTKGTTFNTGVPGNTTRKTWTLDESIPGEINLNVSGDYASLVWRPATVADWSVALDRTNWYDGAVTTYFVQVDSVLFDESGAYSNAVNLAAAVQPALLSVIGASNYTIAGTGRVSGVAAIGKDGTGTLTLGGTANDFSGPVVVSGGVLRAGTSNVLGATTAATIVLGTGTLDVNGFNLGSEPVELAGGSLVNNGAAQQQALTNLLVTGNATIGGATRWDVRGVGAATKVATGATLTKALGTDLVYLGVDGTITNDGTIAVNQGRIAIWNSAIRGTGAFSVASGAVLAIESGSSNPLPVTINGGGLGAPTGTTTAQQGGDVLLTASSLLMASSGTFNVNGLVTDGGAGYAVTKTGGATLNLLRDNSYAGGTLVSGGSLQLGVGGTSGSVAGPITNNASLYYNRSDAIVLSNVVTGTGGVFLRTPAGMTVNGSGSLNVGGNLSVGQDVHGRLDLTTGGVVNVVGEFQAGNPNAAAGAGEVNLNGGALTVGFRTRLGHWGSEVSTFAMDGGTFVQQTNNIFVGWDGIARFFLRGGTITSPGLQMDGNGNSAGVNGTNDLIVATGGSILLGPNGLTYGGTNGAAFLGGVTIGAYSSWTGTLPFLLTGTNGATVIDPGANTIVYNGAMGGAGGLVKKGAGLLALGVSNAFSGDLTINGGQLSANAAGSLGAYDNSAPARTLAVNNSGSSLNLGLNDLFGSGVGQTNLPAIVVGSGGTLSASRYNAIGRLVLNGGSVGGTHHVDSATFQALQLLGGVAVGGTNASTIAVQGTNNAIHLGAPSVFAVADATGDTNVDLLVASPLINQSGNFGSAAGSLVKTGAGTLEMAGTNTYTGPTTVSNGTLRATGILRGSPVSVASGAKLEGTGLIDADVTSDGTVAPGTSPGILTLASNFTQTASGTLAMELGGNLAGIGHDELIVSNAATLAGALTVTLVNGFVPATNDVFVLLDAATVGGTFGSVALPGLPAGQGWDLQYLPGEVVLTITSGAVTATGYDLAASVIGNGLSGYNDDADGDGFANLLEYVTGGSLTNPGTQARMNGGRTNNLLALKFSRDTTATDATIYVEGSYTATNGAAWIGVATNIGGSWGGATNVSESGPSPVSVTVQDTIPAATNRFLRLRVTRP